MTVAGFSAVEILYALLFYGLAAFAIGSAVLVITRRNAVHSALFLVFVFLAIASLFVMLHAEFVAAVQLLVYAGGIMVLFLFVIMLVNLEAAEAFRSRFRQWWVASILASIVFVLLAAAILTRAKVSDMAAGAPLTAQGGNTETLGMELFTKFLLPFEVVSVLLLVAMIGAIVLARKEY